MQRPSGQEPTMFEQTVQKSVDWVDEVARCLRVDRERGYRALRAVLRVLRDRLPPVAAAHFAAQLPMLLRGAYFEGWKPSARPLRIHDPDELFAFVREEMGPCRGLADDVYADDALGAVLRVLARHVSPGELGHVLDRLPSAVRAMGAGATRFQG
jgi:uncharacterized protein (DUF2267 family)